LAGAGLTDVRRLVAFAPFEGFEPFPAFAPFAAGDPSAWGATFDLTGTFAPGAFTAVAVMAVALAPRNGFDRFATNASLATAPLFELRRAFVSGG
jgi:hypothetical protein